MRYGLSRAQALAAVAFLTLSGAGVLAETAPATAAAPSISVNGEAVAVPALVRHGQVFVPVRGVFEKLNANVAYLPPASVVAKKAGKTLADLRLGSRDAVVDGTPRRLQAAPFVSSARVFVPLRLISEAAGASVAYSASPRAVQITSAAPVAPAPVVAASTDVPAQATEQHGIPWWVWLLVALVALALLLAFLRRRKSDPIIVTRSTPSDPTITTRR